MSNLANPDKWCLPSKSEYKNFIDKLGKKNIRQPDSLLFQKHLSPLDVFTLFKARFGAPNGISNIVKSPTSNNLIHWDYILKADNTMIHVMGIHRSVQITIYEFEMYDSLWREVVLGFRKAFKLFSKIKSVEHNKLEKWRVFINRYSELCKHATDHHSNLESLVNFNFNSPVPFDEVKPTEIEKQLKKQIKKYNKLQESCLALKFLTPILLEAFINLVFLVTCKTELRNNKKEYQKKVRENLNTKIPAMYTNCDYFIKPIDTTSTEYTNFTKIMNERNWFIHGNTDPKRDELETVYFEKNTPLFKQPGDVFDKYFNLLIDGFSPRKVLSNYIEAHEFIIHVMNCIEPKFKDRLWLMIESDTIGFNVKEDRFGVLFPDRVVSSQGHGMPNDEKLFEST